MEKFSLLLPALHIFHSKQGPLVVRAKTQQSLANDMELNYSCGRCVTLTVAEHFKYTEYAFGHVCGF